MNSPAAMIDYQRLVDELLLRIAAVSPAPALLNRAEIAHALRVGPAQIDRHAKAGMPIHYVGTKPGTEPRYDLEECRRWLDEREAPVSTHQRHPAGVVKLGRRSR